MERELSQMSQTPCLDSTCGQMAMDADDTCTGKGLGVSMTNGKMDVNMQGWVCFVCENQTGTNESDLIHARMLSSVEQVGMFGWMS